MLWKQHGTRHIADDNELLNHDRTMMYDGDDDDDDANEIDDLLNIVDVAMYSGMTEPY